MWSANYCGDGHPWTEPHEPLLFQDAEGAFLHEAPISWEDDEEPVYEAVWNESGAVCLDTPRRLAEEPTIMTSIRRHCQAQNHPIPTCRSQAWFPKEWREHGTLLTAVP